MFFNLILNALRIYLQHNTNDSPSEPRATQPWTNKPWKTEPRKTDPRKIEPRTPQPWKTKPRIRPNVESDLTLKDLTSNEWNFNTTQHWKDYLESEPWKKSQLEILNYLFKAKPDFPQLHGTFFSLFIILMYYINIIPDAFYDVKNSTVYNTFLKFLLFYIGKNSFYLL